MLWISGMPGVGKTALAVSAAHRLGDGLPGRPAVRRPDRVHPERRARPLRPTALERLLTDLGVPPEAIPQSTAARAELYRRDADRHPHPGRAGQRGVRGAGAQPLLGAAPHAGHQPRTGRARPPPTTSASNRCRRTRRSTCSASSCRPNACTATCDKVREVVARCGHVPLLIHLVAAQFRRHLRWPLAHLLELLREASPVSPDTHFPAAAYVACTVSYDQLTEQQRTLFRFFALAPGPDLSAPGAAALAGRARAARGLLDDLHRMSLLEESAPERFQMLDPLRDYVWPRTHPPTRSRRSTGCWTSTWSATADAVAVLFPFDRDRQPAVDRDQPGRAGVRRPRRGAGLARRGTHNLVAAVHHAADTRPARPHLAAGRAAVAVLLHPRPPARLDRNPAEGRAGPRRLDQHPRPRARPAAAVRRPVAIRRADRGPHARRAGTATVGGARRRPRRGRHAVAIATTAYNLGDFPAAAGTSTAALDRYARSATNAARPTPSTCSAWSASSAATWKTAEHQHLAAIDLLRELDHNTGPRARHWTTSAAYGNDSAGSTRRSPTTPRPATSPSRLGDRACEAYALNNLGNTHRLAGRLDEAVRVPAAGTPRSPTLSSTRTCAPSCTWTAAKPPGPPATTAAALHAYRAALDMSAGMGERVQRARANHRIAAVLHATGQHQPTHWQDALTEFTELGLPGGGRGARAELGDVRLRLRQAQSAS